MDALDFSQLNMAIRTEETRFLTQQQLEQMLDAANYEEALDVLSDTPYSQYIQEARQTQDYEAMVEAELERCYHLILAQAPSDAMRELYALSYDYHNIKILFKEMVAEADFSDHYVNIGSYPIHLFRRAVKSEVKSDLSERFNIAIQGLKERYLETADPAHIDVLIDRAYLHHLDDLMQVFEDAALKRYIQVKIDSLQSSMVLRAIQTGQGANHIRAILTDGGSINVEEYVRLADSNYEEAVLALQESGAFTRAEERLSLASRDSLRAFEKALDDTVTRDYLSEASMEVFGPLPSVAFLEAKETEVRNIRLILTSKLNDIDPALTRERMREHYAV
ncbi:hypothetical protein CL176_02745 [Suicoccus acidiformans]|uniref:V-type ATP synthase subunit C n=1 Tax=Suicoccus acidiformans TaxID=2036206 RepID=A0A347WIX3_9LACT|nr:V-type ATPase subunit [Suicoccus acidiformans]AXY25030.1 hypothetical protein CL176_02745 [Suicoccus acidiformans]